MIKTYLLIIIKAVILAVLIFLGRRFDSLLLYIIAGLFGFQFFLSIIRDSFSETKTDILHESLENLTPVILTVASSASGLMKDEEIQPTSMLGSSIIGLENAAKIYEHAMNTNDIDTKLKGLKTFILCTETLVTTAKNQQLDLSIDAKEELNEMIEAAPEMINVLSKLVESIEINKLENIDSTTY